MGRLGAKPERRSLNDGSAVCSFSIATSERWKDKETQEYRERTDWHRISVLNPKTAEFCCDKLEKGSLVFVEGKLNVRRIEEDKSTTGKAATIVEVLIDKYRGSITAIPTGRKEQNADTEGDSTEEDEIPF